MTVPVSIGSTKRPASVWSQLWKKENIKIFAVLLIPALLVFFIVAYPIFLSNKESKPEKNTCSQNCSATLVESIPDGLIYPNGSPHHLSTYDAWTELIASSKESIDIASFYWTMLGSDVVEDPSDWQGESIFKQLLVTGVQRGIKIRIVQNKPKPHEVNNDTLMLEQMEAAQVRSVDFDRLVGAGVLHTKLWIVDKTHFYVGSANMDWRSLTQVKEMGAMVTNCNCLVEDLQKIFEVYWLLGTPDSQIPPSWPKDLQTIINNKNPLQLNLNNSPARVYFGSSPPSFCPHGRTTDLDTILDAIHKARKFVYIAVMDYFPSMLYTHHPEFWPEIDDALKQVAINKRIKIRLLASQWNHTRPSLVHFLNSLSSLNSSSIHIETKVFIVPTTSPSQAKIPFGRVNHNKYMVTDETAYIGTSNWSGDYFVNTGGVGFSVSGANHTLRKELEDVFERDWFSQFSHPTL